jgi:hypothetical protein
MKNHLIVGFWKFKSNRVRQENGDWITETLSGGTMAFSESGEAVLMLRSEQGPWGYTGKYTFDGEKILIKIETSTADDLDGTTIERKLRFISPDEFIYNGIESHTERPFETNFIRV